MVRASRGRGAAVEVDAGLGVTAAVAPAAAAPCEAPRVADEAWVGCVGWEKDWEGAEAADEGGTPFVWDWDALAMVVVPRGRAAMAGAVGLDGC